jgi:hypothetical protein
MKNLIFVILLFFSGNLFCQTTYNSSITTKYRLEGEVIEKERNITITDTEITITNFVGGTQPLNLKVNGIKEIEDQWDGLKKWYYCIRMDKHVLSGKHSEYVIIVKKSYPSEMEVNQKVDEVTFIKTVLSLN